MKWFKHDTDTSSDPKIKLLRKKFGAEGLWVYFETNRLIAQNVNEEVEEWGYLAKEYTDNMELLADEVCAETVQKLTSIYQSCNELGLLYQTSTGRILNPKILLRADRYTEQKAREHNINLNEYVQKLYRMCTETAPRTEKNRIEEKRKENNANALQKTADPGETPIAATLTRPSYGNTTINGLIELLKASMSLPVLDDTEEKNRRYCHLAITKFTEEGVRAIIQAAANDQFWRNQITSFRTLYYNGVKIAASVRKKGGVYDATAVA